MKNCDCPTNIGAKIAEFMKSKAGDDAQAKIQGTAFVITDDGLETVLQIPFRVKGSKKGYTSDRGKEIGCNASFCPFCGKPANRKVAEGIDDGIEAAWFGLATQATKGGSNE